MVWRDKMLQCLIFNIVLIYVPNDLFLLSVYITMFIFRSGNRTSKLFCYKFEKIYAKEVIMSLLLAQKTPQKIAKVVGQVVNHSLSH